MGCVNNRANLCPKRAGMRAMAALLMALLAQGCGGGDDGGGGRGDDDSDDAAPRDRGDVEVVWGEPTDEISAELAMFLRDNEFFEQLAAGLNQTLKFPRDLPVAHVGCGEANAYYDPNKGTLSMCYELLSSITQAAFDPEDSEQVLLERIVGTWTFVFFHELGHALIDMYDLPTTGREEDAVDDFSTVLLIEADRADYALRAAEYWASLDTGELTNMSFADEHSLTQQRFYAILCLVYGSDPESYAGLVSQGEDGLLPMSRAVRCEDEYRAKRTAWETLLEPWSK